MPNQKTTSNRSWTTCSAQFCCGLVFHWRLMKGDTKCAECGSAYPPYEQHARKQWSDDSITSITTQLKDVFKELFPSLPEAAQEKLKTSFPGLVQTLEAPKSTFLALQQKLLSVYQEG